MLKPKGLDDFHPSAGRIAGEINFTQQDLLHLTIAERECSIQVCGWKIFTSHMGMCLIINNQIKTNNPSAAYVNSSADTERATFMWFAPLQGRKNTFLVLKTQLSRLIAAVLSTTAQIKECGWNTVIAYMSNSMLMYLWEFSGCMMRREQAILSQNRTKQPSNLEKQRDWRTITAWYSPMVLRCQVLSPRED